MRIYLDNCCFNRPFDDQSQLRIRLESEAKLKIQDDIKEGVFQLIWSYILQSENEVNPYDERQRVVRVWKKHAIMDISETPSILEKGAKLMQMGLWTKDALHIACATEAECEWFLTTDDKILNKNSSILELTITDPIGFIREIYPWQTQKLK